MSKIQGFMKDPCRVCGVRLVGSQCRWIFSSSGRRKLQVILSHVLGREVIRDGHGEFLCGKCVFQLEKVIQFDINIGKLQDQHSSQIQKLQTEKEHLIQCIRHVYSKNNTGSRGKWGTSSKALPRSSGAGSPDDEAACLPAHEGQQFMERESGEGENRMRRCLSLDRIVSKGGLPARSGFRSSRPGSRAGCDSFMQNTGLAGTRHCSRSVYLDLVQRKGTLSRQRFKAHSTSLQSLNRDFSLDIPLDAPHKQKLIESKMFATGYGLTNVPRGKGQGKALLRSSSNHPPVISDVIHILRCISKQHLSAPAGSRIPVLKRLNAGSFITKAKFRNREADWKSLHDLTEEFNDEYTPVREKVVNVFVLCG